MNKPIKVVTCNSCGAYRSCKIYNDLWLCVDGPSKCYRSRKTISSIKKRKVEEQEWLNEHKPKKNTKFKKTLIS